MILRIPLRFEGSKGEKHLYALFDSGATYSCISEKNATELANLEHLHTPMRLATASDTTYMEITDCARLDFYHEDIRLSDEFLVVPGLSEEAIIGAATMQKWKLKMDFEHDTVIVDPNVAKLILINLIKKDRS
jgi:predicted aspartyl protease